MVFLRTGPVRGCRHYGTVDNPRHCWWRKCVTAPYSGLQVWDVHPVEVLPVVIACPACRVELATHQVEGGRLVMMVAASTCNLRLRVDVPQWDM